jgi:hypothetical protein
MNSLPEASFGVEFEHASEGCCGTATGFRFSHPGMEKRQTRYYVHATVPGEIAIQRIAGEEQALDNLPGNLAQRIVGVWLRHEIVNTLATTPPRTGEPAQCTVK